MLALILVAVSVGLSNLAASVGVGAGGITAAARLRVLLVFGVLEAAMPVIGLVAGRSLATGIGAQARWLAAVLLAAVGGYGVIAALRARRAPEPGSPEPGSPEPGSPEPGSPEPGNPEPGTAAGTASGTGGARPAARLAGGRAGSGSGSGWLRLLISGVALSMDNVVAGFALGAYRVGLITGAITFGTVSVLMSLAGLEFGARIGKRAGERGELIGGLVLIGVGAAIGLGALG